jgi:aspartokinase
VALEAASSTQADKPTPSAPLASFGRQNAPQIGARIVDINPDVNPIGFGNPKNIVPAPLLDRSEIGLVKAVTVRGFDPNKPAGVIFVVGREPAVLIKKMRQDDSEGTRIDVIQGVIQNIAIASNEIFRVAQGRDINIFYQGRKVAAQTIASGAWISFVPQSPGGAGE